MRSRSVPGVIAALMVGCGGGYTDADTASDKATAVVEAAQYSACATDDARTCTPAFMRATSTVAYCGNARNLSAHGRPIPPAPAGLTCPRP
jgi:hypothetical protein